jgi:hypothetical protein
MPLKGVSLQRGGIFNGAALRITVPLTLLEDICRTAIWASRETGHEMVRSFALPIAFGRILYASLR